MTTEIPWAAEGSDKNPTAGTNDALESLGFTFSEESSAQKQVPPVDTTFDFAWTVGHSADGDPTAAVSTNVSTSADIATAALEQVPTGSSTELVPLSRRALREAERSQTGARRARRSTPTVAVAAATASVPPVPMTSPLSGSPASKAQIAPSALAVSTGPTTPGVSLRRRIAKKTFPPIVMIAAAALLVGTSVPATALFDPDAPPASTAMATIGAAEAADDAELVEGQVVEVEVTGELAANVAARDDWSVTSYAEMLRLKYGSRDFSYSTSGSGAVRWPFPAAVPISSGFGERVAPCRWCSSYHQGLDFNPGAGTPIFAIADGVVIQSEYSGGFGQHAIIEHVINGQRVTSTYAHMTGGSSPLVVGDQVLVGDFVGTVGSTGTSTGAHLHFEIRIDDIPIDPFAWLQANGS